ncbi:hypothetical protein WHR41_02602 [Cladosporium halotolerans]|uniref:Uncharacterized protein n=1 Tax=Cladosporium halotolerans TaxID=1052096 RepID=A0AB34KX91_9PEZI
MAPQVRALAQSESKAKFMERLGLDERNLDDKHLYHMMKEEASAGRNRMLAMPGFLREESKENAQPPFSNAQINETATHREIMNIYRHARPETRAYYDLGHDTDGLEEENWVIRWLLWHVFRYRDNRNKSRRQGVSGRRSPNSSDRSGSEVPGPIINEDFNSAPAAKSGFYDPVRDQ